MSGGIGIPMGQGEILKYLRNPSGVADLLIEQNPETGDSPAEIFADVVNVMRADTARLGAALGVEIEVPRMTPERAAELLAGTVGGDGVAIVVMFNEEAERRDKLLREVLDPDDYEQFMAAKKGAMFTTPADDDGDQDTDAIEG